MAHLDIGMTMADGTGVPRLAVLHRLCCHLGPFEIVCTLDAQHDDDTHRAHLDGAEVATWPARTDER